MSRPVCRKRGSPDGQASPRTRRPDAEWTNPRVTARDSEPVTPLGEILAVQGGEEVG